MYVFHDGKLLEAYYLIRNGHGAWFCSNCGSSVEYKHDIDCCPHCYASLIVPDYDDFYDCCGNAFSP